MMSSHPALNKTRDYAYFECGPLFWDFFENFTTCLIFFPCVIFYRHFILIFCCWGCHQFL